MVEAEGARTQELVVRWSPDGGRSFQEVVRQQWHFDPAGSTREVEDYRVELAGVTVLELVIDPDLGVGRAPATLRRLQLGG